jgi:hypothetical protein
MTINSSAVVRTVVHAGAGLASVADVARRLCRRSAYPVLVLVVALQGTPALADDAAASKKVGTERIVVTPAPAPPAAPTAAAPAAAAPSPNPAPAVAGPEPRPEIHAAGDLPPPAVAEMRRRLLEAAYSGDLERLRRLIGESPTPPIFSINEIGDPIEYIQTQSGDGKGLEVLAILTDVLEASWVRINPGTPQEVYVWPSFAATSLADLPPNRLVEIYKIVTSSDFEEMKNVGHYTFYNVGIAADGSWRWFKLAD